MIITFVNLTLHEDLSGEQNTTVNTTANGPPTMVDTLSFTTALTAGVNPVMVLIPATMAAQLTGVNINGTLGRTDIHQVIVGLALPAPLSSLGISAQPQFPKLISGSPKNAGEAAALEAVNNQILRFQLPRPLIVAP
jgi:hypothetical protein